ncbi:hypothetical protein GMLC_35890 [Geomonas limicola]|uniref:Uncharacterized protein n=1 Tax=Geomonas limicola TaxID=2740186 RepID=A0A6V8NC53_9BACT|nr:hypothetical protein GMLC_35890 [Geomonas limicola]
MRVEDAHADQLLVLADHLQDDLDILGVADAHRVVDAALDGVEQKVAALTGGVDELLLLAAQGQTRKGPDAEDE